MPHASETRMTLTGITHEYSESEGSGTRLLAVTLVVLRQVPNADQASGILVDAPMALPSL